MVLITDQTETIPSVRVCLARCGYCWQYPRLMYSYWYEGDTIQWLETLSTSSSVQVSKRTVRMLSGWLVATRYSSRNLAHGHLSHSYREIICWSVASMYGGSDWPAPSSRNRKNSVNTFKKPGKRWVRSEIGPWKHTRRSLIKSEIFSTS